MRRHIAAAGSALLVVLLAGCAGAGSGGPQQGNGTTALPEAPTCGTSPVVLNAVLRDGVRPAVQAVRGVHQAVPERDLGHQAGPVPEPDQCHTAPALRGQPARPDPAAHDGVPRQGRAAEEPGRLRGRVRLGQVAGGAAGAEPGRRRRHPGLRVALRDGPQLQPHRCLLQQEAGHAGRDDGSRRRRWPSSKRCSPRPRPRACCRSWSGTPPPAAAASRSRCRQLMAAYGPTQPINDWIFQKPGATIDTPANRRRPSTCSGGSRPGTSRADANAIEYTDANGRVPRRRRPVHVQRRLGERELDKGMAGNVGFFLFPPKDDGWQAVAAMSAPLTYGIGGQGEERRLRRLLPQLGRDRTQRPARSTSRSAARTRAVRPTWRSRAGRRRHRSRPRPWRPARRSPRPTARWTSSPNATGAIFAQGWTPELQKMVGGKQTPPGCSARSRPSTSGNCKGASLTANRTARPRTGRPDRRDQHPASRTLRRTPLRGGPPDGRWRLAVRRCRRC